MAPNRAQESLNALVNAATELLGSLHTSTLAISKPPASVPPTAPSPDAPSPTSALALARDSASLIKAHTTKLSLLIINEPFTPSAIQSILHDLIDKPAPALLAAAQACDAGRHTSLMRKELAWRCSMVFKELIVLVGKIPRDGKVIPVDQRQGLGGVNKGAKAGSITVTGVLWAACDEVIKLVDGGVVGVLVRKVGEWRDTIRDVMEELKEWGEEEEDEGYAEDDDVEEAFEDDADDASAQGMIDKLMASHKVIPRDDPDKLRPRLETTIKSLRLTTHLYQAVIKRRFSSFPSELTASTAQSVEAAAEALSTLPELCGDLAGAFYELDAAEVAKLVKRCGTEAVEVTRLLERTWDGEEDEFTKWVARFRKEMEVEMGGSGR